MKTKKQKNKKENQKNKRCINCLKICRLSKKKDKKGKKKKNRLLNLLYTTVKGRILLKILTLPIISKIVGAFLDTRLSRPLIPLFKVTSHISMKDYERRHYRSFNDFFTRKVRPGKRPIDKKKSHLISPCDGKVSVYKIEDDLVLDIKNSKYTLDSILRDKALADEFSGGTCVVIRLSVDNYHRYAYVDSGKKGKNIFIKGVLHTVNPLSFKYFDIFKENSREYTVIDTDNFGKVIQMEVGALLVGRIVNYDDTCKVKRGDEKGKFEYGGSTVILFLQKDTAVLDKKFWKNTAKGSETEVKLGECIGRLSK